jgi:hypothetical protein
LVLRVGNKWKGGGEGDCSVDEIEFDKPTTTHTSTASLSSSMSAAKHESSGKPAKPPPATAKPIWISTTGLGGVPVVFASSASLVTWEPSSPALFMAKVSPGPAALPVVGLVPVVCVCGVMVKQKKGKERKSVWQCVLVPALVLGTYLLCSRLRRLDVGCCCCRSVGQLRERGSRVAHHTHRCRLHPD